MHYNVTFTGSKADKEKQALKACEDFLGTARLNFVISTVAEEIKRLQDKGVRRTVIYRNISLALSFTGVQGYRPVRAILKAAILENNRG